MILIIKSNYFSYSINRLVFIMNKDCVLSGQDLVLKYTVVTFSPLTPAGLWQRLLYIVVGFV
jgi:hypothetical protein